MPRRLKALVGRGTTFSIADQVLVSGLNFVVGIVAARALGVAEFGLFALILVMANLATTCLQNIVTVPMMTLAGSRSKRSSAYFSAVARLGIVGSVLSGLALLIFIVVLFAARGTPADASLFVAVTFFTFAQSIQFLVRRILFAQHRYVHALILDAARVILIIVNVALLVASEVTVTTANALDVLAISGLLSSAPFLFLFIKTRIRRGFTRTVLVRHWPISSWLLLMMLVSIGQEQALWFISSLEYGDEATGALRAGQYLLGVTHFLMLALENFLPNKAAEEYRDHGIPGLRRYLYGQTLFVGAASLSLILPIAIFAEPLLATLFGQQYAEYSELTQIFAIIYAITTVRVVWIYYLRVVERTKDIFICYLVSSIAALIIVYPMMSWAHVSGIAYTMLAAQVVLLLGVLIQVARHGSGKTARSPFSLMGRTLPTAREPQP